MNAAKKAITKMPLRTLRSGDRVSLTQYGSFGQLGGFKDRKLLKKKVTVHTSDAYEKFAF